MGFERISAVKRVTDASVTIPVLTVEDGMATCSTKSGAVLDFFEGVAYYEDIGSFVRTMLCAGVRSFVVLGALNYEGAIAEAEEAAKQQSFDW